MIPLWLHQVFEIVGAASCGLLLVAMVWLVFCTRE